MPSKPGSPSKISVAGNVGHILASKKLTLHQVSHLSESRYGRSSPYFIPHNFYNELRREAFSPSIYQFAALSRISGYRLRDWLGLFGFDLGEIPRLQATLPAKRTVLIDSSLVDPETTIPWFRSSPRQTQTPDVAPLSQLLELAHQKRMGSIATIAARGRLYAKIGFEDALAFPDLLPGSLVGINRQIPQHMLPAQNGIASRHLFVVEHSKGIFCCRLRSLDENVLVPVSDTLPYGQVELRHPGKVRIVGIADLEIRALPIIKPPEVPSDLAKRWQPRLLEHSSRLSQLLNSSRAKLKFSLHFASSLSRQIAQIMGDDRYSISLSALSEYEATNVPPRHLHKILTLCVIYGLSFAKFLEIIGISNAQLGHEPMARDLVVTEPGLHFPIRDSDQPDPARAGFLTELLGSISDVPFFLRNSITQLSGIAEPSLADFFWIGGEKTPLHPSLDQGLIVMVNRRKKKPIHYRSRPVWEQPIYILLLREGRYLCACCSVEGDRLVLHPYPQQVHRSVEFRDQKDAEVIGQVVAIVRNLL